jgi:hypothetical protein
VSFGKSIIVAKSLVQISFLLLHGNHRFKRNFRFKNVINLILKDANER